MNYYLKSCSLINNFLAAIAVQQLEYFLTDFLNLCLPIACRNNNWQSTLNSKTLTDRLDISMPQWRLSKTKKIATRLLLSILRNKCLRHNRIMRRHAKSLRKQVLIYNSLSLKLFRTATESLQLRRLHQSIRNSTSKKEKRKSDT